MLATELKHHLQQHLEGCDITVSAAGNKYELLIVGEVFSGLSPVKKQQLVYSHINDLIADGSIHAVTMKTLTPNQWARLTDEERQVLAGQGL